jgi:hypothetical protein
MYRGFNLKIHGGNPFIDGKQIGKVLFDTEKENVRREITKYVKDGAIDATKLQADWFGPEDADVFISHSHQDVDVALSLSGWLYWKLGLRSFVDSTVWGYADDLLKSIDDTYCLNEGGQTYSYESRNRSTSHVHMMLSCALSTMMDRAECIIFLNTPSSIIAKDVINEATASLTASPWIYAELMTSKLIEKREPQRRALDSIEKSSQERIIADSAVPFHYEVELFHLTGLTAQDMQRWGEQGLTGSHALDGLYALKPSK